MAEGRVPPVTTSGDGMELKVLIQVCRTAVKPNELKLDIAGQFLKGWERPGRECRGLLGWEDEGIQFMGRVIHMKVMGGRSLSFRFWSHFAG